MIEEVERRGGAWRIAVILAIVVVIAAAIFWRWRNMDYEELPGWGRGDLKVSEQAYCMGRIANINQSWYWESRELKCDGEGRFTEDRGMILVVDTARGALWLERGGVVDRDNYAELPENMQWTIWRCTPEGNTEAGTVIRAKMRGKHTGRLTPEKIFVVGHGRGNDHLSVQIDSTHVHYDYSNMPPVAIKINWRKLNEGVEPYGSIVVEDEEYERITKETSRSEAIGQEPVSNWLRMGNLVYGAVEKQVNAMGYDLTKLDVYASPEGNSARAQLECRKGGFRARFSGYMRRDTSLKIDYLGDDVWYARSGPAFGQFGMIGRGHLDMEFLIYPRGTVDKSQAKDLIARGRKEHPFEANPTSEFKAVLDNGVTIELLGICKSPSIGGRWWGVDGKSLDYEPLFYEKPSRSPREGERYEIAWKFGWPAGTNRSNIERLFNAKNKRTSNRGGTHASEEIIVEGIDCDEPGEPASLSFKIKIGSQAVADEVTFANISLTPGKDHGVKIETASKE